MSDPLSRSSVPRIRDGFRFQWEQAQECWVLLYPEGMITLNGSAGAVLSRVDACRTVGDLIKSLETEFPEADLAEDVLQFLEHARERGWIETV